MATLGPARDDREKLHAAVEAGVDVVRLNFFHGDHEGHRRRLETVRELSAWPSQPPSGNYVRDITMSHASQ